MRCRLAADSALPLLHVPQVLRQPVITLVHPNSTLVHSHCRLAADPGAALPVVTLAHLNSTLFHSNCRLAADPKLPFLHLLPGHGRRTSFGSDQQRREAMLCLLREEEYARYAELAVAEGSCSGV